MQKAHLIPVVGVGEVYKIHTKFLCQTCNLVAPTQLTYIMASLTTFLLFGHLTGFLKKIIIKTQKTMNRKSPAGFRTYIYIYIYIYIDLCAAEDHLSIPK